MPITQLLFGFKGRIGRLKFFLTSLVVGLVYIGLLIMMMGPLLFALTSEDPVRVQNAMSESGLSLGFGFFALSILGAWIQLALVWKRVRDMNETQTYAWVYVCFIVLSLVPVLGLIASLVTFIMNVIMWFKAPKDAYGDYTSPDIFGTADNNGGDAYVPAGSAPTSAIASMSTQDLVARAAQLREQVAPSQPQVAAAPTMARRAGVLGQGGGANRQVLFGKAGR